MAERANCIDCHERPRDGDDGLCPHCRCVGQSVTLFAQIAHRWKRSGGGFQEMVVNCPACDQPNAAVVKVRGSHRGRPIIRGACKRCEWRAMT